MRKLPVILSMIYLLASVHITDAYETPTHRALSEQAVEKSVLRTNGTVLEALGLKPLYGLSDPRRGENEKFPSGEKQKDIFDLVGDGSVFEDDLPRPINHFYDPVNNQPLTDCGPGSLFCQYLSLTQRSPDWALEDRGEVTGLFAQNDSFFDARKLLLGALIEETKPVRDQLFGRTFQALGQIIHHLQDMAQPQHVRNDEHLLPPSLYEHSSNAPSVLGNIQAGLYTNSYPRVPFDSARKFWVTREDGTVETGRGTGQGIAEFTVNNFVSARRNFRVSPSAPLDRPIEAADILPHDDYPRPNNESASVLTIPVGNPDLGGIEVYVDPPLSPLLANPLDGKISFIGTPITDTYYPSFSGFNSLTSTFSVYGEDLRRYNFPPPCDDPNRSRFCRSQAQFTLNEFNFEAARTRLLPRAIAYSAGLIDYFFRGKVEMCDGENSDQSIIKNLSPTEDMKGVFALYSDGENGVRQPIASWRTTDPGLLPEEANGILVKNGGELRVSFVPPDPKPDTYLLVFYGDMGNEVAPRDGDGNILPGGAIVAKQVDTTKHCKGTVWVADRTSSSVLAYNLPDGRPLGSFSLPNVWGIAYDPTDGNLWYTTMGSNTIEKVTPTGTPVAGAFTVTGMIPSYDGQEPQLLGLDADPSDPIFVWVAVSPIYSSAISVGQSYVYKVRTTDGPEGTLAGQVVHQCRVVENLEFTSANVGNGLIAVSETELGTVVLVSPIGGTVRRPLYVEQVGEDSCTAIASIEYFLTPHAAAPTGYMSGHLSGVETSGNEVIAVVTVPPTFTTQGVYTFGSPPSTTVQSSFPVPADIAVSDLAVGSSF